MKRTEILILIIWGGVSFRIGVFTTESKAKKFLVKMISGMKVWVESIDDGKDTHYIKDDLIAYVDLTASLSKISDKITELVAKNPEHGYNIIITEIKQNKPIQIH